MISKILNIDLWNKPTDTIKVVRYEADGRKLQIRLTSGGAAVNLTGCSVNFYAKKPETQNIVYNACTITGATTGQVEYVFTEQTVNEAGTLECTITIDKTGEATRSQTFNITVTDSPNVSSAVESTSEFTALEEALALVSGLVARITALEAAIPSIGDLDFNTTGINPGTTKYPGTTWVAWGSGLVPVGVDTSQAEFNTVEKTGGEKTHTLTVEELAPHYHDETVTHLEFATNWDGTYATRDTGLAYVKPGGVTGGNQAHNNLQPYITCYMWKRTA